MQPAIQEPPPSPSFEPNEAPETINYSQNISTLFTTNTKRAHNAIHQSEIAGKLSRGELPKDEYIYFMMILWRVYNAMEEGLEMHSTNPVLAPTYRPALLSRTSRLSADIAYLLDTTEDAWQSTPLYRSLVSAPPQGLRDYIARLEQLTVSKDSTENSRLLAHAYVRYLGDLSGGQSIRNRVAKAYDLPDTGAGASFYDFGSLQGSTGAGEKKTTQGELLKIKEWYREGMNEAVGDNKELKDALVQEANLAFDLNRRIFQDVEAATKDTELSDYTPQSRVVFDGSEVPEEKTYPVSSVVAFVMALALAHFILVVGGFTGAREADNAFPPRSPTHTKGWSHLKRLAALLASASGALSPLKDIVDGLVKCIEFCEKQANGHREYAALKNELEALFEDLEVHLVCSTSPTMTPCIEGLYKSIKEELDCLLDKQSGRTSLRAFEAGKDLNTILAIYRRIQGHLQRLSCKSINVEGYGSAYCRSAVGSHLCSSEPSWPFTTRSLQFDASARA
ncbi:hypothetical protein OPQ81_011438 [Rhizoctonia solani]|nr:hypothetical protein OPQ81_011438 [Rhizoctonia solani]